MISARLLSIWDSFLGSAALIALIVLAFGIMMRAVKREDALHHLGVIAGIVILFIVLPTIIVSLWEAMLLRAHIGIWLIFIVTAIYLTAAQRRSNQPRR